MARMLTEEEVAKMERQHELRGRAYKTMSWNERKRFEEAQEREMYEERYRGSHGGLSRAEVAAAGPDGSGRQNAAIKRGFELQAQREFEQKRLGEELGTRRFEAEQRRKGMAEQGMKAAEFNKEAAIRAAELQTASAEKVAGINTAGAKEIAEINSNRDKDVETIRGKNALEVAKDQGDAQTEVARINKEGIVEAEREKAAAQTRSEYAQNLMRQRMVDERTAWQYSGRIMQEAQKLRNSTKRNGRPTMSLEEAMERVKRGMPEPGKKREDYTY